LDTGGAQTSGGGVEGAGHGFFNGHAEEGGAL
jgi:hypothetical protein